MSSDLPASNEACETIPPVQSSYAPTGQTIKLAAYDEVYAVGDQTSSTVIIGKSILVCTPLGEWHLDLELEGEWLHSSGRIACLAASGSSIGLFLQCP